VKKKNETIELEQRVGELTIDLQRVRADFENYRKRMEQERAAMMEVAKAATVMKMLPMIDDIERAIGHAPKEIAGNEWVKGVKALEKRLEKSLKDMGVVRILSKPGTEFDPEVHEAVMMEDSEGEKEVIVEELRSGYKMGSEVVRAAMVRVGRK